MFLDPQDIYNRAFRILLFLIGNIIKAHILTSKKHVFYLFCFFKLEISDTSDFKWKEEKQHLHLFYCRLIIHSGQVLEISDTFDFKWKEKKNSICTYFIVEWLYIPVKLQAKNSIFTHSKSISKPIKDVNDTTNIFKTIY